MHSLRHRAVRAASAPAAAAALTSSSSVFSSSLSSAAFLSLGVECPPAAATPLPPAPRLLPSQPLSPPPTHSSSPPLTPPSLSPPFPPASLTPHWRQTPLALPFSAPSSPAALPETPALRLLHAPPHRHHQQQEQQQGRVLSTSVGQGSGGRVQGPGLHEPPESHPFAVKGLNHIALAVPNLAQAAEHYRTVFGAQVSDPHALVDHGVTVVFVHVGSTTIELLEPLGDNSPISKFLEKHPRGGLHHLGFTVDNIDIAAQHVAEEGVKVLGDYFDRPGAGGEAAEKAGLKPQIGAHGNPVVFLDPRDNLGVLCELEQVFCHER